MIVDASALLAILFDEPEKAEYRDFLLMQPDLAMSPVNYLEAAVRADDKRHTKGAELDKLITGFGIEIAVVDARRASLAHEAYRTYGRGNHPAKLNLGDCFAYALSKARGESLLFKGNDFPQTDVQAAL